MIKILPILIIPLFFLIVYSGVKNLTQNKLNNVVKKTEIKENSNNNYDLTSKAKSIKTMKSEQLASNEPDKKNVVEEKNSDTATIENDKESKKAEETVKKNPKQEKNVLKMTTLKKNKSEVESLKKVLIQFGAFSRKDNAENSKKEIEKKIKKKFEEVNLNINFLKDKKLYKLVYLANSESVAKSICDFSKKIKINCLIKNK